MSEGWEDRANDLGILLFSLRALLNTRIHAQSSSLLSFSFSANLYESSQDLRMQIDKSCAE